MRYLLALIMILAASTADAATLYVNGGHASCDDTRAKANVTADLPWCSIGRAAWGNASRSSPSSAEAAAAGDVVLVAPGTYTTVGMDVIGCTSCLRLEVAYNSYNSGSSGNPITYRCTTARGCNLTYSSGAGPMIGACGTSGGCTFGAVDYITWDGFVIDEATAPSVPDTGPAVLAYTTGSTIQNCTIDGNGGTPADNHTGVRVQGSTGSTVRNNIIHDFTNTAVNPYNAAGIQVYNSYQSVFEHNEIYNVGSGIFLKELTSGALSGTSYIRFNFIHDTTQNGIMLNRISAGPVWQVYQNIIANTGASAYAGIVFWRFDVTGHGRDATVVNNTIYNANGGCLGWYLDPVAGDNNRVWNNLCAASDAGLYAENVTIATLSDATAQDIEHNVYYSATNVARLNGTNYTLATWQSGSSQDGATPAASTSDPVFVNAGGSYLLATDFKLQGSSPFLAQGVDVLDLDGDGSTSDTIPVGAYITGSETIGIEGANSPPVFNPTINLRRSELEMLRDDLTAFQTEQAARWARVCAVLGRTRTTWAANMRREIPC